MTLTLILVGYVIAAGVIFWAVTKRQRVVRPTTFADAAKRFNKSLVEVQIVMVDALTPALIRATEAINRFHKAMAEAQTTGSERDK